MTNLSKTDGFLKAKIKSIIAIAEKNSSSKFSSFLDVHQCVVASELLHHMSGLKSKFWGGSDECERKILCVYPDYLSEEDIEYPITILQISYKKGYTLSHRDFLGALMALQIKREALGDIWIEDGMAQIAVSEALSDFILTNVNKIGNVGVKVSVSDKVSIISPPKFKELTGTVSSLRIDSVLGILTGMSRGKAVSLISTQKVEINYVIANANDELLKPNDVIVVRGYGKHILTDEIHMTKKGRYHIKINKYI